MFHFKQFSVDQSGCAMKINTDGVLLGALVVADGPATILDIGTGTGVIAMMLAQRFNTAFVEAVEIDETAAETAGRNFEQSPFKDRLMAHAQGFDTFFDQYPERKYDLIVSNPPFYTASLRSPTEKVNLAKHADPVFFESLTKAVAAHLTPTGLCCLVLPLDTAAIVTKLAEQQGLLVQKIIEVHSYKDEPPHRHIITFGHEAKRIDVEQLVIYSAPSVYTKAYANALKHFLTIF